MSSKANGEWIPIEWMRAAEHASADIRAHLGPKISRMRSPFYAGERFAVRQGSECLAANGEWEYEPLPSARDDAFYARCRFGTFEDAVLAVYKAESIAAKEPGGAK